MPRKAAKAAGPKLVQSSTLDSPLYFANSFRVSMGANDASLSFEIIALAPDGTNAVKTQAHIVMTHQGLKLLSNSLVRILEHFEKARGPIVLPEKEPVPVTEVKSQS